MDRNDEFNKGYILVMLAGICWGSTGIIVKGIITLGVGVENIAFIRMFFGFLSLMIYLGFKNKKLLRIDKRGLLITAIMGLTTQTVFNYVFFNSIRLIGVASATVLLYLAPVFLLIWSILFFNEKMSRIKILGVILCVISSYLAITGGIVDFEKLSITGVLLGIASGLSYSLVSVFSKLALKKYRPETIVLYAFMFGFIFTLPMIQINDLVNQFKNPDFLLLAFGLGTISSSIPYVLYFGGISTGIDLSKAGVLSMMELIVSICLSVALLREYMSFTKAAGVILIIVSIGIIRNSDYFERKFKRCKA
ncbi:DMT family transporter [Fusibacter ferrireducens]|uniref:EamA family transporter n=1 Tax=Fusibacter ferrireducens TaxID=2785058 RepID=A0ABR9ZYK3_9FIRM|nr:DMT family transporter [Fusibacter ferrireducens]MBF4695548.1 EamA family transporter [Fusibacter ferrireducens]